jgi:cytochrome c-type biogenesis protein CcmH
MTLGLILALMTAAAIFAVIWPLARHAGPARSGSDIAVYRDQLDEVERDLAAGLIGKTEAEAARVEISRRLLGAADAAQAAPPAANAAAWRRRAVAVASLLVLPIVAGGLYLRLGSPELASAQPVALRNVAPAEQSVESLLAQAEAHLTRNPEDGRGWELLAPVYMRLDRYSESVTAWRNTLQLLGESAERQSNLGEALTAEANGVVTADAKAAFVRAMTLDDTIVGARYYLGLAAEQDGQRENAAKIWRDLIAEAPAGASWVSDVRNALARVESPSTAPPPGPSAAQMTAAADQPPEQEAAVIRGMVDRLAARLKQDGSDLDGWVRLVRSYKVLGEAEKARAAAADAQQALASDPGKLQQFNAALKELDADHAAAPAPTPVPGAAQMPAAGAPPDHESMVDRLAARLKQDGSDLDGWVRLVRSYKVLGEAEKARAAAADAQQALASDPGKLQQFNAALKELDADHAATPAPAPVPGAAQMPAAGAPPDHQQGATIQSMVERLAERLKISGSDPQGWLMLARSYMTLGEKDKATAAISDARHALAGDPDKLEQFNSALKHFSIGE